MQKNALRCACISCGLAFGAFGHSQQPASGVTIRVFGLAVAVAKSYSDQFPSNDYAFISVG